MKNKRDLLTVSEALEILSKKIKISEQTFKEWCRDGLVKYREEPHGMFKWKKISRAEIERILALLPKERVNGLPLLPRKPR